MSRIIPISSPYTNMQSAAGSVAAGRKCGSAAKTLGIIAAYGRQQKTDMNSTAKNPKGKMNLRDIKRLLTQSNSPNDPLKAYSNNSVLDGSQSYSDTLRMQRMNSKNTALNVKKLKYQFKDVSARIIRSKTSLAAKQAAGQAQREIQRLKRAKQSGKYDAEELEAAINHAMAMERVAKKKARHLEEEEMAAAAGGVGMTLSEDEEEMKDEALKEDELNEGESYEDETSKDSESSESYDSFSANEDYASVNESMSDIMSQMQELAGEMADEFNESMKDMLEELGLDDLTEDMMGATGKMDIEDLKTMKINHRNKEMKDIAKADGEYLKAMFNHLQKLLSGASAQGADPTAESLPDMTGAAAPAMAVPTMPMIDVAL